MCPSPTNRLQEFLAACFLHTSRWLAAGTFVLVSPIGLFSGEPSSGKPQFEKQISSMLTKQGCNSGTCHGSLHGKGGFRLSLKGQDPELDYRSIVEDLAGRRIDLVEPNQSLILTKPTGGIPHQGGVRFESDSIAYRDFLNWLRHGAQGPGEANDSAIHQIDRIEIRQLRPDGDAIPEAELWLSWPENQIKLRCIAIRKDGTSEDITDWAKLDCSSLEGVSVDAVGSIRVERPLSTTVTAFYLGKHAAIRINVVDSGKQHVRGAASDHWVDVLIDDRLRKLGLESEPMAAPEVWLKRLYLTVLGRLPTLTEQEIYHADPPSTRDPLAIDRVLSDPQYAALLALRWSDVLRNEPKVMSEKGVGLWYEWLRECFDRDIPLNEIMATMLTSMGSTFDNPAASFHRTHRDPNTAAEAVGQVYLGIRMQCAKCHNHPFDIWTQDDYYGLSAFFVPIERKQIDNQPRDKLDTHVITGDEIISWSDRGTEILHPGRSKNVGARGIAWDRSSERPETARATLEDLANSMTAGNPQFERNMANRIWAHVMGRGIVDPVDDFRSSNPPSNPELLEQLRLQFVSHGYSVRWLMREILSSAAFRRESVYDSEADSDNSRVSQFAGFVPRRMMAEVLQDAVADATQTINTFEPQTEAKDEKLADKIQARAVWYASVPKKHSLLRAFGKPERLTDCDCERSSDVSLRQSLLLLNDEQITSRLRDPQGIIHRLAASVSNAIAFEFAIEELYKHMLCRAPSHEEKEHLRTLYHDPDLVAEYLEDIAWSLINSKEFLFIR